MCKCSRKSAFSSYVQQKNKQIILLTSCQLDARRLAEGKLYFRFFLKRLVTKCAKLTEFPVDKGTAPGERFFVVVNDDETQ